jgi:hypothetical protein
MSIPFMLMGQFLFYIVQQVIQFIHTCPSLAISATSTLPSAVL